MWYRPSNGFKQGHYERLCACVTSCLLTNQNLLLSFIQQSGAWVLHGTVMHQQLTCNWLVSLWHTTLKYVHLLPTVDSFCSAVQRQTEENWRVCQTPTWGPTPAACSTSASVPHSFLKISWGWPYSVHWFMNNVLLLTKSHSFTLLRPWCCTIHHFFQT